MQLGVDGSKYDVKGGRIGKYEKMGLPPSERNNDGIEETAGRTRFSSQGPESDLERATDQGNTIVIDLTREEGAD